MLAAATDFAYMATAVWGRSPLLPWLRRWAQYRYRRLAPQYDTYIARDDDYGAPLLAALDRLDGSPRRILDVSTGTGYAAEVAASRYPRADIAGCDVSMPMIARARRRMPQLLVACCDSTQLPFRDGAFDLVTLLNAPPRLGELARLVAPRGWLVLGFSTGAAVPAWLRLQLVQRLRKLHFPNVVWGQAGHGFFLIATRDAAGVSG